MREFGMKHLIFVVFFFVSTNASNARTLYSFLLKNLLLIQAFSTRSENSSIVASVNDMTTRYVQQQRK